ncbi:hypothetical protein DSO57_1038170 [Entomophthora muscae]|uniref:Uncharacterized protein n=2 Tax=Entomophthora muscae TaxID=34485 RepID=A0ACC2SZ63_9FUNG|nr:hypothetical protein DSO57_1013448 [Entomophthora muscae]KAJ9067541.1 hypothetical protein DSO57_1038170 [Entomophthora muscae]
MLTLANRLPFKPPTSRSACSEKWENIDTWILLDVLVGLREEFQNSRRHPELWYRVSFILAHRGIFKSHDKCRNRWKVLVAKYKRHCSHVLKHKSSNKFEFQEPIQILLANQLNFNGQSLVRTFKNGIKVELAASDSDLLPLRKLTSRRPHELGDPWGSSTFA